MEVAIALLTPVQTSKGTRMRDHWRVYPGEIAPPDGQAISALATASVALGTRESLPPPYPGSVVQLAHYCEAFSLCGVSA